MSKTIEKKTFSRYKEPRIEYPHFAKEQLNSFRLLMDEGVKEIFKEFSPIKDYSEKKFDLDFTKIELGEPKYNEYFAKKNMLTYEAPLRAVVTLKNKTIGGTKEQEIFLTDFPIMTDHGTFIINGVERVIVPQLARSFGVFFNTRELKGKNYFGAKIIPARGAWVEIESEADGAIYVKIDRKRKFPVTSLLRVMGATYDKDMFDLLKHNPHAKAVLEETLEKDTAKSVDEAFIEIHRRLRDGDLATAKNARDHIKSIFSEERYDLSKVGRRHFNQRFGMSIDAHELERRTISLDDIVLIVSNIITLNNTPNSVSDDIDHLGFRRVRYVGELLQQKIRIGMSRMKRNIQDRMSTVEAETTLPIQFINPRPFQAAIKEFFTTNQLSQFMGQQNILSEVEHLRRLSALGPGGLTRERAGFEVRDVHPSHYGRLCPIHTPEGPNIGLILNLATYARVNEFGIIETPYLKVEKGKVTSEIVYFNALEEEKLKIAHAATPYNESTGLIDEKVVEVRLKGEPILIQREKIEFMDVATNQAFSIAPSMIPFLEHDDANRALMGSNMQKQATPCILPEAPLVATGIEERVARDSGRLVYAIEAGEVTYVDAQKIIIKGTKGETEYPLINYLRTNDFSAFHQRPTVNAGQKVKKGELLADNSSSDNGQAALGQNIKVAFMSWYGANYEDAIIISERLVKNSRFTSIHVEEFSVSVRDTKLGPEVTTHDIPNVGEVKLRNLDEEGIIRIGAEVRPGDIL
ncbi:MAG TPA: DNA-directed RNA polymerase subunit beta, partial [Candidatus Kaiserbacteria bacterium]|nr:DNA-directed RNA polymerase subunit beta [Candidatus Kaiserbacteria bacterium]